MITRGDTITIDGRDYYVTRIEAGPTRGQIDLIAKSEAIRRRDDLDGLIGDR